MKVLHTADWHIGELPGPVVAGENARMLDTINCIDSLISNAKEIQPDIIIIAGDLFNKSKLWADQMLREIGLATVKLRKSAAIAPTVLLFGTKSHDNLEAFRIIRDMKINNLYVVTEPELLNIQTKIGMVQVAGLPGLDKGHFRTQYPGMDPETENIMCSCYLAEIIGRLSRSLNGNCPSILVSHYTVVPANGIDEFYERNVFAKNEVVLPTEALNESNFDLICLGHEHSLGKIDSCQIPTYYAGTVNRIKAKEEDQQKGFWLHNVGSPSVAFNTPARRYHTQEWDQRDVDRFLQGGKLSPIAFDNAIVRLHYNCDAETARQLDRKGLERELYAAGAFWVQEIIPQKIVTTLTKDDMSETADPLFNLDGWLMAEGYDNVEIAKLVELTEPLLATVSAKIPTGKLSGIFKPISLEVENYRSYRRESFNFNQIKFAVVNGPNGIGKSAFFMDAICDCLYEELREGKGADLTSWISNGDQIKYGTIRFTFSMGDTTWRTIRSRTKAGKVTLSLQELVDSQWADRGGVTKPETQDKIINLLGMDANTFRCCALIMQDAYGVFMEADKTERMEVLGNILGLNVYEMLKDLAKAKLTEANRNLEKNKSKASELAERLKALPGLRNDLSETEQEIRLCGDRIAERQGEIKAVQGEVLALEGKQKKVSELMDTVSKLENNVLGFKVNLVEEQSKLDAANGLLIQEAEILEKAAEYEEAKIRVVLLQSKDKQRARLEIDKFDAKGNLTRVNHKISGLDTKIAELESVLAHKTEIDDAVEEYHKLSVKLATMNELEEKWAHANIKTDRAKSDWERKYAELQGNVRLAKSKIAGLENKVKMLDDSNCIDAENAKCKFLSDAQAAKVELPKLQGELNEFVKMCDHTTVPDLFEAYQLAKEAGEALGYDADSHKKIRKTLQDLRSSVDLAAQLDGKAAVLENLRENNVHDQAAKREVEAKLAEILAELQGLNEELRPYEDLQASLPELAAWVEKKDKLPAAREIAKSAAEAIGRLEKSICDTETEIAMIEAEKKVLTTDVKGLEVAKQRLAERNRRLAGLQDTLNSLHGESGALKSKIQALEVEELEHMQVVKEIEPLAKLVSQYHLLSKAFGIDGIPFAIVRAIVPELSAMANDILGQMTGGKMQIEIKTEKAQKSNGKEVNALEIWITDYERGTLPYKSRSGGQKVKAALSVAFALADLKASRAGLQLGFMFVDEPPFLDEEGTDAYCDALELLNHRYSGMQVIAITHDPRMKARFPQVIEVIDLGAEGSKVRVA